VACLQRSAPHTAHFYTFVVPGACQIRSPSHAHTTFTGGVLRDDDLLAPLLSKVEGFFLDFLIAKQITPLTAW
jgi:hypothetical protein